MMSWGGRTPVEASLFFNPPAVILPSVPQIGISFEPPV